MFWDNKLTGGDWGEGWWISKREDIYLALKSTSMVLKRLKSVVFGPVTVLAKQECVIWTERVDQWILYVGWIALDKSFHTTKSAASKLSWLTTRLNPVTIPIVDIGVNQLDGFLSKCKDLVWWIPHYEASTDQIFPGWKGFFYETEHPALDKHTVAYLSTINKSPT